MADDPSDQTTAVSLLEAVWSNEPTGWKRLFELYTPFIYRYCRAAGLSPDDAADIGQEVFQSVVRGIARFRREKEGSTFRGWLRTITRNKIIDFYRRSKRNSTVSIEQLGMISDGMPGPRFAADDIVDVDVLSPTVCHAIDKVRGEFEQKTWQAFWLTVVEERQPSAVADELKMSVNSVYLARSRLLRRLREKLGDVKGD